MSPPSDRMKISLERTAHGESRERTQEARLLEFEGKRQRSLVNGYKTQTRHGGPRVFEQTPRVRFLRAIEMERRGFSDGAVAHLHHLCREVEVESDPSLAICICYFLASFLMIRGEVEEARALTEDGILLAWEHGAEEELELLEHLSGQLED